MANGGSPKTKREAKSQQNWVWHDTLLEQLDEVADTLAEVKYNCGLKKLEE